MRVLIVGFAVASLFRLSGLLAAEPGIARANEVTGRQLGAKLERFLQAAVSVDKLRRLDFSGADLRNRRLLRPNLAERMAGLSFDEFYTSDDYQNGKDIFTADLSQVKLNDAILDKVDLHGACLVSASLRRVQMRGTNLRNGVLNRANLEEADLSNADLRGVRLSGANLRGVNLSGADMRGVNLSQADLSGANLNGAKHLDSTLGKALFDVDTLFPPNFNPAAAGWVLDDRLR
jgi:uncharacterized protein YjbI with pentapeptide repeats